MRVGAKLKTFGKFWISRSRGRTVEALGFNNLEARQALQYAVDRDTMCNSLLDTCGTPAPLVDVPGPSVWSTDFGARYESDPAMMDTMARMETRLLGSTGLAVSPVCVGGTEFADLTNFAAFGYDVPERARWTPCAPSLPAR